MKNNEFKFKWDINSNVISNLIRSINIDHPNGTTVNVMIINFIFIN